MTVIVSLKVPLGLLQHLAIQHEGTAGERGTGLTQQCHVSLPGYLHLRW